MFKQLQRAWFAIGAVLAIASLSPGPARAQPEPSSTRAAASGSRTPTSEAEEAPNLGVDPTEPSALPPMVALPARSRAPDRDDEPVQEAVPGDPWGDTGGDTLLTLR